MPPASASGSIAVACASRSSRASARRTPIVDASALEARDGALFADGRRVDLVYNRVTDFYLAEDRHAALRRAYGADSAVITPHPATRARWADKRLLAWLRDEALLRAARRYRGQTTNFRTPGGGLAPVLTLPA